jgi:hypothetical protein
MALPDVMNISSNHYIDKDYYSTLPKTYQCKSIYLEASYMRGVL